MRARNSVGLTGLGQVVVGARLDAANDGRSLIEGRDHDHRQSLEAGITFHVGQHLIAVEARHHEVEQDQVEIPAGQHVQGLFAAFRHRHLVTVGEQSPAQEVAVGFDIVDHQDAAGLLGRSIVVLSGVGHQVVEHGRRVGAQPSSGIAQVAT